MEKITVGQRDYYFGQLTDMPEEFSGFEVKGSAIKYAQGHFGKILCQLISLENFELRYCVFRMKEDCLLQLKTRKRWLDIHFALKGDHDYSFAKRGTTIIRESQCLLTCLPASVTSVYFQKGKEYICLDLACQPAQLKWFGTVFPFARSLVKGRQLGFSASFPQRAYPITFAIGNIIDEILYADYSGEAQGAYRKIKVAELLFHLMSLALTNGNGAVKLHEAHKDKLYEAKKFIEDNYRSHYSIHSMARKYGMNTTTFKVGFREEFSMGPFELLVKIRMAKAMALLKERRLAVNEIADQTGYKSFSSFIKAFKRYFDFTPGSMRNKNI